MINMNSFSRLPIINMLMYVVVVVVVFSKIS